MKLSAILFDLDGTLLPMDNDYFTEYYFTFLARAAYAWGYHDRDALIAAIWKGVAAMVKNDGSRSNAAAFWERFREITGRSDPEDESRFNQFYATEFNKAAAAAFPTPLAREAVRIAREKADHVILATNPIFPRSADETRLSWLGLSCRDFDLVTDYENCCFSKPNPEYYRQIIRDFRLDPARCLMIGNDADEDMLAASRAELPVFLLTDHLINRQGREVDCPNGSYEDMLACLRRL